LEVEVSTTPRREIVEAALANQGALLLADDWQDALDFARAYAAEHLALFTADPRSDMEQTQTAGTVFLGEAAAVAYGDYITGANHVLPTGGMARSFSSLSTLHYLRMYTWQEITSEAASAMSGAVERMAHSEGLPAHAEAVRARSELS
jgi:histidinol dehydrogenase